jgi:hypothetical protein
MGVISRDKRGTGALALTAAEGTTEAIPYSGITGMVYLSAAATITFYGATSEGGDYTVLNRRTSADTDWTAFENVSLTAAAEGWFPVPDECAAFPWIKMVLGSGTMSDAEIQPVT